MCIIRDGIDVWVICRPLFAPLKQDKAKYIVQIELGSVKFFERNQYFYSARMH